MPWLQWIRSLIVSTLKSSLFSTMAADSGHARANRPAQTSSDSHNNKKVRPKATATTGSMVAKILNALKGSVCLVKGLIRLDHNPKAPNWEGQQLPTFEKSQRANLCQSSAATVALWLRWGVTYDHTPMCFFGKGISHQIHAVNTTQMEKYHAVSNNNTLKNVLMRC